MSHLQSGVPNADIKRTNTAEQPKDALIARLLHNLGTASSAARQDDVDWPKPTPREDGAASGEIGICDPSGRGVGR